MPNELGRPSTLTPDTVGTRDLRGEILPPQWCFFIPRYFSRHRSPINPRPAALRGKGCDTAENGVAPEPRCLAGRGLSSEVARQASGLNSGWTSGLRHRKRKVGQAGADDIEDRREQETEDGHAQHAEEHRGAQRLAHLGAGAVATTSGTTPRMKAKRGHQDGTEPRARGAHGGLRGRRTGLLGLRANSTIRIAFLAASPTSTTKPI